jgi:hypothetical protein
MWIFFFVFRVQNYQRVVITFGNISRARLLEFIGCFLVDISSEGSFLLSEGVNVGQYCVSLLFTILD